MAADKLGFMFIYTSPSKLYSRKAIEDALAANGFDPVHMPTLGDSGDKFRSGTSYAIKEFSRDHKKDALNRKVKIKLTDVHVDDTVIQKDIVQEIVKAKTLSGAGSDGDLHENAIEESIAKLTWRRKFGSTVAEKLVVYPKLHPDGSLDTSAWAPGIDYTQLLATLEQTVEEMFDSVTDVQLRAMVRKMLSLELHSRDASPVRGTFFVPADREHRMHDFKDLLNDIDPDIFAQSWTLYDEGNVKAELQAYFEGDMEREVQELLQEMTDAIVAGGAKANKRTRFEAAILDFEKASKAYDGFVGKAKIEAMLTQAKLQLQMVADATSNSKAAREAAKEVNAEKERGLAKLPKGQRAPGGKLHIAQPAAPLIHKPAANAGQIATSGKGLFQS